MLWLEGDGLLHRVLPAGHILTGQAVDQVQSEVFDLGLPDGGHRLPGLLPGVGPVEGLQLVVVGRLHPQRDPVHARPAQADHALFVHAVRVGFQGDLGVARHLKAFFYGGEELPQALFPVKTGGAAAEIDGVHQIALGLGSRLLQMGQQGLLIGVHAGFPLRQGVKVAVVAFALTEGNVDVKAQLPAHSGPTLLLVPDVFLL